MSSVDILFLLSLSSRSIHTQLPALIPPRKPPLSLLFLPTSVSSSRHLCSGSFLFIFSKENERVLPMRKVASSTNSLRVDLEERAGVSSVLLLYRSYQEIGLVLYSEGRLCVVGKTRKGKTK